MTATIVSAEEQTHKIAVEVAHGYLQSVKCWMPNDYLLEDVEPAKTGEASTIVLDGIYKADLHADQRGGGQSVQLYVDTQSRQVLHELAYQ